MQYLEYVQPTGNRTTYTNTGIYVNDTEFEFQFEYLYFPQQNTGGDWSECLGTGYPSKFRFGSNPSTFVMYGGGPWTTTATTLEGQVTINKTGLYVDNVQLISYNASTPTGGYLTIGGDYDYPSDSLVKSETKLGRFKVYHNSVLVGDFVPAIDNNVVGWYDEVGQIFKGSDGTNPWIAGPALSSIVINPTSSSVKATGGTIEVAISTDNSWVANPTDGSWYSLSETGGTGDTAITITVPSYTGSTERQDTITFVDTNTTDEMVFTLTQKKYQTGQPMFLGSDEIVEFYLGDHQINEMYLGEVLVYSSGPFAGLKLKPSSLMFTPNNEEQEIKIKSSEAWTLTVPAWITASQLTGDTGETIVSLTATTQTASTTGSVEVTTNSYTAETEVTYALVNYLDYIHSSNMRNCNGGGNDGDFILTNIVPDNTTYAIVEGREVGYVVGGVLIGYSTNDSNDWRLFHTTQTAWYTDIGSNRCNGSLGTDGTLPIDYNITFGNLYASNSVTSASITGTTWGGTLTGESIKINLAVDWIKRVRIYTQNALVFDGQAAELEGEYGFYDSVSEELFSSSSFTIVGETTN